MSEAYCPGSEYEFVFVVAVVAVVVVVAAEPLAAVEVLFVWDPHLVPSWPFS